MAGVPFQALGVQVVAVLHFVGVPVSACLASEVEVPSGWQESNLVALDEDVDNASLVDLLHHYL